MRLTKAKLQREIDYLKQCVRQANGMVRNLGISIYWEENAYSPAKPEKIIRKTDKKETQP